MAGLSFLSPAFLLGALAAALPIALHLLGRRPRVQVAFPAVRLLKRAPAAETRRRRLRDLLVLALRVGAILLLAVAFARPYFVRSQTPGAARAVVVAVDRSFSMGAPGEFERARATARSAVAGVAGGTPVGLVAFDDEASVLVKPTMDRGAAFREIARVQPGFGGTSYGAALARSAEALSGSGRVIVVTDLQRTGWNRQDAAIPDRLDVVVNDVGGVPSNVAVANIARDTDGVAAVLWNSGTPMRMGKARLLVGGRVRAMQPFSLSAGAVQRIVFAGPPPATGEVAVEVDDASGYQADNRAYALLDPPDVPVLLAITSHGDASHGPFYLRQALEVDGARLFRLDVKDAATMPSTPDAAALQTYSGVILLGTRGLRSDTQGALDEYVRHGGRVLVTLDDQVDEAAVGRLVASSVNVRFEGAAARPGGLLLSDLRHPLFTPLGGAGLDDVRFERIAHTDLRQGSVLARFADGVPALVEVRRGDGRVVLFASDLSNRWNNLPLQPAFLPLVHEIARYLAGERVPARDFSIGALPPGVPRVPGITAVAVGGTGTALRTGGAHVRRIAVNVNPGESDVGRMTIPEFQQAITRRGGALPSRSQEDTRQAAQQQSIWRAALAVAIAALIVEGAVGKPART
jgi:hypothetical protein